MVANETADLSAFTAYNLFCYSYAVLYSPRFREDNKEFLNRDFPIVPYPVSKDQFWRLAKLGNALIELHLLHGVKNDLGIEFSGRGAVVEKVSYDNGKVFINKYSFFDSVPEDVWGVIVGGYQPCHRWLRERKGCTLNDDDLNWYISLVNAISQTLAIMEQIDLELS